MKLYGIEKKKKNYLSLSALPVLFLFLIGTVSLLSACGGPYSAPGSSSSSSSSSSNGNSSVTTLTAAQVTQAQGVVNAASCGGCHTLTKLGWTGTVGPDLSTIGQTDTLNQLETAVAAMPMGSPMASANVDVASEYLAYETGAAYVTE